MPGLGTIINTAAIVVGGLLGLLFKNLLTKSMEDTLLKASSVCVLFIGIGGAMQHMLKITDGALETSGSMMLIICFVLGSIVGELLDIEGAFERFGAWLRKKTHNESDTGFLSAFIHASLTVCIGAMAIVGSIQDGLLGDYFDAFRVCDFALKIYPRSATLLAITLNTCARSGADGETYLTAAESLGRENWNEPRLFKDAAEYCRTRALCCPPEQTEAYFEKALSVWRSPKQRSSLKAITAIRPILKKRSRAASARSTL